MGKTIFQVVMLGWLKVSLVLQLWLAPLALILFLFGRSKAATRCIAIFVLYTGVHWLLDATLETWQAIHSHSVIEWGLKTISSMLLISALIVGAFVFGKRLLRFDEKARFPAIAVLLVSGLLNSFWFFGSDGFAMLWPITSFRLTATFALIQASPYLLAALLISKRIISESVPKEKSTA